MTAEADSVAQITHDTAHVAEGVAMLYRQFRGKPNLTALLTAWLTQVQDLEDALWALLTCTLETAVGAQLDQLDAVLGFGRGTLADKDYQVCLQGVVAARRSSGTAEDLIGVATLILGADAVAYVEGGASAYIEPTVPVSFARALLTVLLMAKAGGVELQLKNPGTGPALLFTLSSDPFRSIKSDASRGFGDTSETTGGRLTGVLAA